MLPPGSGTDSSLRVKTRDVKTRDVVSFFEFAPQDAADAPLGPGDEHATLSHSAGATKEAFALAVREFREP